MSNISGEKEFNKLYFAFCFICIRYSVLEKLQFLLIIEENYGDFNAVYYFSLKINWKSFLAKIGDVWLGLGSKVSDGVTIFKAWVRVFTPKYIKSIMSIFSRHSPHYLLFCRSGSIQCRSRLIYSRISLICSYESLVRGGQRRALSEGTVRFMNTFNVSWHCVIKEAHGIPWDSS